MSAGSDKAAVADVHRRLCDEQLLERIRAVWLDRTDRYSELRARLRETAAQPKVEMYYIGG